jgi:uncharacterized membrane protein
MKPQTDEVTSTEEPTSADMTTMTTTEAVTEITSPTTDQTEATTTATVIPTTFEPTTETDTTREALTQSHTTTAEADDRTSQPASSNSVGATEPQAGGDLSLGIVVGPIVGVVLLLIGGAVIVVAMVLFRKRKKSVGRYSTSNKGIKYRHKGVGEYA